MEELVSATLALGAHKATLIPADSVMLSTTFRDICATNSCGSYGRCHMCPPDIGPIASLMEQVRPFRYALLYQTVHALEDSYDFEGMMDAAAAHAQLSQRVEHAVRALIGNHLHLSCGGCHLCESCTKPAGLPCRHPDAALPPMEGYGIDVYQTVKNTELRYINGRDTVTYFGIVLFGGND